MAERLARDGCSVTGITLSPAQLAYARERNMRADLRLQDYRESSGSYDRVVSVEMLEAVGEAFWPRYFQILQARLKPGGVAVLQVITIDDARFESYRRTPDFIQRYIFPGGMLPPPSGVCRKHLAAAGLTLRHQENFGDSYTQTLVAWRRRFSEAWPTIAALGFSERFRRMWEFYLCYCLEAGFRTGRGRRRTVADHQAGLIHRRGLLAAATSACLAPAGNQRAFRIVRNGSAIGTHVLTFERADNGLDIHIAVDIAVGFGPITFFRYTLRGLEQWRNGAVVHVNATTNDDDSPEHMRADRDASGLWVEGSKAPRYLAPTEAMPATHWNISELNAPWINPQDGRLLHPVVQRIGDETLTMPNGATRSATHFVLSGDAKLDLWYDAACQWSALRFTAKDGSLVRYELA